MLNSPSSAASLEQVSRTSGPQLSWAIYLGSSHPDFDEQIATASKIPFGSAGGGTSVNVNELALRHALYDYRDRFLAMSAATLSADQDSRLTMEIEQLLPRASSATGQRSAFQVIHDILTADTASVINPTDDSLMRGQSRNISGLSLFPAMSNATITIGDDGPIAEQAPPARLLDVEVVAIYW